MTLRRTAALASLSLVLVGLAAAPAHAAASSTSGQVHRKPGTVELVRRKAGPNVTQSPAAVKSAHLQAAKLSNWDVTYHGFPTAAHDAFAAAVATWSTIVSSPQTIHVDATWEDMSSLGSDILGGAGPDYQIQGPGIGDGTSYYADALADSLNNKDNDPGYTDIDATFNSASPGWYFGTDGNVPTGQVDFESVVLHELGHGLGFSGSSDDVNGVGLFDCLHPNAADPSMRACPGKGYEIYDTFLENTAGTRLTTLPDNTTTLGSAYTHPVYWGGANGTVADGGTRIKLYAPSSWSDGSSIAHMDEDTYSGANGLMTPYLTGNEAIHVPGPLVLAIMRDTGWKTAYDVGKVTGVVADGYDGEIKLSWSAPTSPGYPVSSYTVNWTHQGVAQPPQTTTATSLDLTGLTDGDSYAFTVTAANAVGYGPASDSVVGVPAPDTTPPSVSFATTPAFVKPDGSLAFTGSDPNHPSAALTYQCGVDTTSLTACTSPVSFASSPLTTGPHTLYVSATDEAGNAMASPAQFDFTVDATAPTVAIASGPSGTWTSAATYTFSGSDSASSVTYRCQLDGGALTPCTSPKTYTALSQGSHTFDVYAVDVAGNVSSADSRSFLFDAGNPTVTANALTPYNLNSAVGLRYSGTDSGSGVTSYDVRYRKAAFNGTFPSSYTSMTPPSGTTSLITTIPAARGYTYCFQAQSHDASGRVSGWSAERCTATALDDRALAASSGWGRGTGSPYYGSTVTATTKAGQVLTRTGVQARRVYLVATSCRGCGTVDVLWNGTRIARINLNATTTTYKRVIGVYDFGAVRSGTLQVKTVNTGRTYIDGVDLSRV